MRTTLDLPAELLEEARALLQFRSKTAWVEAAVEKGECFGVGDLLIAAIATEQGGRVWSRDDDFARMSRMGFVRLFSPAARGA